MPTAIVTGASRGLGLELARALAQRGWRLVIDGREAGPLEAARAELARSTQVVALAGSVGDEWHRGALVEAAGPRLDALVNNASTLGPTPLRPLAELEPEALAEVLAINALAPLRLVQLALGLLVPGGCVVAVSSDAAVEGYPGWGAYGSSKAALDQLTRVLAAEHPELRVYAVDPGDMRTRMHQEAFPGEDISDRAWPAERVPALLALLEGELPSGRYRAIELLAAAA